MMDLAGIERTRLFVDGVRVPITADVTQRRAGGLVVTQPLHFLRLDTTVVEDGGAPARISRVAIDMDGDVPRLLLELERCEELTDAVITEIAPQVTGREDTIPAFTPGVSMRPARTDSTVPYEMSSRADEKSTEIVIGTPSVPSTAIETAPLARVERRSWWSRLVRQLSAIVRELLGRPLPALPQG